MGLENALRFDQYSVRPTKRGMQVVQLLKGVDSLFAAVLAEITTEEFEQSVIHTGWVGTCPTWLGNMPLVTVPKDELLGMDHLDFMVEELQL